MATENNLTDADYLKSPELGTVVAKGMAVMYAQNPKNPVDFLAKWLLNYAQVQRAKDDQNESKRLVGEHRQANDEKLKADQKVRETEEKAQEALETEKQEFYAEIDISTDLSDNLQMLADHLQKFTNATACYIGGLVAPKKPINDSDDDRAHLDRDADKIIHLTHSSKDFEFLVDKILKKGEGVTFDVFTDKEGEDKKSEVRHEIITEVVREPRIHFFRVPKLGSYLAIRLEYASCLNEDALNEGIANYLAVREKQREQEELKREHEEKERERKEECEANETEYIYNPGEWPDIKPSAFQKKRKQFVVCLNTMGQDRTFTQEEIDLALNTVKDFCKEWERTEEENLRGDIQRKLDQTEKDKIYKEQHESLDQAEMDRRAEEALSNPDAEIQTEEQRAAALKVAKFDLLTKSFWDPDAAQQHARNMERERARNNASASQDARSKTPGGSEHNADVTPVQEYTPLVPEQWKQGFLELKEIHVMKMPRVLQTLFYLLRYKREDICERDTNKLDFKKVKALIKDDLFIKMSLYKVQGPSMDDYIAYQKLAFLRKNLEAIEEERVEEFSMVLAKIYRWVVTAIELRIEDVQSRRNHSAFLRYEREQAIKEDAARTEKRQAALEEKQQEHEAVQQDQAEKHLGAQDSADEDGNPIEKTEYIKQEFPLDEFEVEFEAMNPPIEIPDEVVEDIDNDFDIPFTPVDPSAE